MTKTCAKCGIPKDLEDFNRNKKLRDGRHSYCKSCVSAGRKQFPSHRVGSIENFIRTHWHSVNQRTVNGRWKLDARAHRSYQAKGVKLEMTLEEFTSFCQLNWPKIEALRAAGQKPSLDRKNSDGHYSIDNLQIISLRENILKRRNVKMAPDLVHQLQTRAAAGEPTRELAHAFGISPVTVRAIKRGYLWKDDLLPISCLPGTAPRKLGFEKAREIRSLLPTRSINSLAKDYGVSWQTIKAIADGKVYRE